MMAHLTHAKAVGACVWCPCVRDRHKRSFRLGTAVQTEAPAALSKLQQVAEPALLTQAVSFDA